MIFVTASEVRFAGVQLIVLPATFHKVPDTVYPSKSRRMTPASPLVVGGGGGEVGSVGVVVPPLPLPEPFPLLPFGGFPLFAMGSCTAALFCKLKSVRPKLHDYNSSLLVFTSATGSFEACFV